MPLGVESTLLRKNRSYLSQESVYIHELGRGCAVSKNIMCSVQCFYTIIYVFNPGTNQSEIISKFMTEPYNYITKKNRCNNHSKTDIIKNPLHQK